MLSDRVPSASTWTNSRPIFVRHVPKGVIEPLPSREVVRRCNRRTAGHGSGTRQRQNQNPDRLTSPYVATPSISPENTPDIEFIRTLRSALQSGCNECPPIPRELEEEANRARGQTHRARPWWRTKAPRAAESYLVERICHPQGTLFFSHSFAWALA